MLTTASESLTLTAHGAQIPALGFGTSPMTGSMAADEIVAALKAGYRHIDAARKYGTEQTVGEGMRASGVPRKDIFLTTKVSHENLHAADFARSVDASLKALGTDYVDLLLVHWPNPEIPLAETMPALAKAKQQGKARHVGVANFNITLLDQAIKLCPEPLTCLQAEYHPYLDQSKLLAALRQRGMAFVAYCPLGRGRLFDDPVLTGIAQSRGKSIAQIALRLADAARRRRDPALVQPAAHRRQFQGVRFHAQRRRDEADFGVEAGQRPHRQSGRARQRRLGLGQRPATPRNGLETLTRHTCLTRSREGVHERSRPTGKSVSPRGFAARGRGAGRRAVVRGALLHARLNRPLLPMPDADGPAFVIFAAGVAFLFAGLLCFIRARTGMKDNQTSLPEDSPGRIKLSYQMLGIGVFGAFATIGTWVAIGSGSRNFTVSSPLGAMQTTGDLVGRTVFGLGAVIVWICVIALTISTVAQAATIAVDRQPTRITILPKCAPAAMWL